MARTISVPPSIVSLLHTINTCKNQDQLKGLEQVANANLKKYPGFYRTVYSAYDKQMEALAPPAEGVSPIVTETPSRFSDDLQPGECDPQ